MGNDLVHVVFCEQAISGTPWEESSYSPDTIGGALGVVSIVVTPISGNSHCVIEQKIRQDALTQVGHLVQPVQRMLPMSDAPKAVARMAVLADIACHVHFEDTLGGVSNWEARLGHIRRLIMRQS